MVNTAALAAQMWQGIPVLMRVSGLFLVAPVFGSHFVPAQIKVFIILVTTLAIYPVAVAAATSAPTGAGLAVAALGGGDLWSMVALAAQELAVGLLLGYASLLAFVGIQVAGQFLDTEMGFGIINVIDPQLNQVSPLLGNFQYLLALLIFLATNGHYTLLSALAQSYRLLPVGGPRLTVGEPVLGFMLSLFSGLFITALKVAAPVLAALFLTTVALGLLARAVPQLNIFMVGLPAKAIIGLALMAVLMPGYLALLENVLGGIRPALARLLGVMHP